MRARTGLEGRALIRWNRPGVVVGFTTRLGGVSEGAYASLNLGRLTRDPQENVELMNRRLYYSQSRAVEELGISQTPVDDIFARLQV